MINGNSRYIAMHLDRLNEELINEMYGKREYESQKKKQKTNSDIQINNADNNK